MSFGRTSGNRSQEDRSKDNFPGAPVEISFDDLIRGHLLGLTAEILGSLHPAIEAARMNPVKALSYE
jgi:ABC-type lipoprotein release transport system permease subunit